MRIMPQLRTSSQCYLTQLTETKSNHGRLAEPRLAWREVLLNARGMSLGGYRYLLAISRGYTVQ